MPCGAYVSRLPPQSENIRKEEEDCIGHDAIAVNSTTSPILPCLQRTRAAGPAHSGGKNRLRLSVKRRRPGLEVKADEMEISKTSEAVRIRGYTGKPWLSAHGDELSVYGEIEIMLADGEENSILQTSSRFF